MDNSHVALVAVKLLANGFKRYRCDRPMPLGVNLTSLTKVLKCAKDDDICTLKASDEADLLNLVYEAKSKFFFFFFLGWGCHRCSLFFFRVCLLNTFIFFFLN